ncbi:hypothetical protein NME41_07165 [Streptococcus agalactiae]|nr:hypothetical protein [Streptococcus agalactiae]
MRQQQKHFPKSFINKRRDAFWIRSRNKIEIPLNKVNIIIKSGDTLPLISFPKTLSSHKIKPSSKNIFDNFVKPIVVVVHHIEDSSYFIFHNMSPTIL